MYMYLFIFFLYSTSRRFPYKFKDIDNFVSHENKCI